jgi:high-affinity iron transporter
MVFTLAIVFASNVHGVIVGGAAGLVASLAIAFGIYHLGKRVNVAMFFRVVGAVLILFAAGILIDAVENLQQLGWLPVLTEPMWHTAHLLSEDSTLGDIFHSFFGYADTPTVGQAVVYVVYLLGTFSAFFGLKGKGRPASQNAASKPPGLPTATG